MSMMMTSMVMISKIKVPKILGKCQEGLTRTLYDCSTPDDQIDLRTVAGMISRCLMWHLYVHLI